MPYTIFFCLLKEILYTKLERLHASPFKCRVVKIFIDGEPNATRGQRCGHVFKSVTWNFGSKIVLLCWQFCLKHGPRSRDNNYSERLPSLRLL